MTEKPAIRVLLVDDHEVVRRGLCALLEAEGGFEVVSEAGSVAEAVRRVGYDSPDVVLMDVRLPDGSGIGACREIRNRWPEVKVLILTSYADEEALVDAIQAGAAGYVLKRIDTGELMKSIRRVAQGESLIDPVMTERLFANIRGANSDPLLGRLSPQERRVLDLIATGMTNKQIAQQMFLATKTIKNYVSSLLGKLEMSRRSEAAAYAARLSVGSRVRYPPETWDDKGL